MMLPLHRRPICISSAFLVPFLTFADPRWLSISGIGPSWSVLWLLPWALEAGPISSLFAGFCIGLVMDGLSLGGATQIPVLMFLGWWWGNLGRRGSPLERSFNLGLLAWLGTFLLGLSLWIQIMFSFFEITGPSLKAWGWQTLLLQSLVTGLVAPIICSLLLLLWRKKIMF